MEIQKKPPMSHCDSLVVVVLGCMVVESQKKPPTSHWDLLVVIVGCMTVSHRVDYKALVSIFLNK